MNVAIDRLTTETARGSLPNIIDALFKDMGVPGVYARTALYERVVERLGALVSSHRPDDAEELRFPPVMSRVDLERSGYLQSFPNLLGCVAVLDGAEDQIRESLARFETGGDWTNGLAGADLVLSPAACYPVYPLAARRGPCPHGGWVFDVACDCFRREPSAHPDRLQSFRMREYVRIGTAADVLGFRTAWMERAQAIASDLGLAARIAPASDPFFGREGQMRGVSQIQQSLKFELLIHTWSTERPTACMSFNYHRDHFGSVWGIRDEEGEQAHTGCVAFGLDRLALALFCAHGIELHRWPDRLRKVLHL